MFKHDYLKFISTYQFSYYMVIEDYSITIEVICILFYLKVLYTNSKN